MMINKILIDQLLHLLDEGKRERKTFSDIKGSEIIGFDKGIDKGIDKGFDSALVRDSIGSTTISIGDSRRDVIRRSNPLLVPIPIASLGSFQVI